MYIVDDESQRDLNPQVHIYIMASLPSPPFVDVPGCANFRGIGGQYVGPGLVYRSADPSKTTQAGLEKMSKDLGKVGLLNVCVYAKVIADAFNQASE